MGATVAFLRRSKLKWTRKRWRWSWEAIPMDRGGPEVGRDGILLKRRNYCDPISLKLFWVVGRPGPQFSTSKLPSEITSCSEAFRPTWSSSESTEYLQDSNSRVCEKKPC